MSAIFLLTSLSTLILFVITYYLAILIRNNSIIDIVWGLGFVLVAIVSYSMSSSTLSNLMILIFILIWGLRLSTHIFLRNFGKGEDFRYQKMRSNMGDGWVWRSFFEIYLVQWVLMQLVSIPIVLGIIGSNPPSLWQSILGIFIWIFGFYFEFVGDYQLSKFIRNKSNKGKLMTKGLWSLTRHPNYFGEATLWWGVALLAYSVTSNALVFLGPITIDLLLVFVSGIPLLEAKYKGRADWKAYAKRTPAFFPRFKV